MNKIRLPFMAFALVNLLAGLLAGLTRIGWSFPVSSMAVHHGAIMVGGFLGTLILLEKVIPLKKRVLLILPLVNALSLLMIIPGFLFLGRFFLVAGAVSLLLIFVVYLRQQPGDLSVMMMTAGAMCQIVGHFILLSKQFYPAALPWWMGFVLFIIVGERLELSKFLPVSLRARYVLVSLSILFIIGVCLPFHSIGKYLSGVALVAISLWLMRYDVISIAIKKKGLMRFSAIALLGAYISLLLTGIFLISFPDLPYSYDAIVHTFFLGFTFSMIFAHGPIILPGVLGINIKPYHPALFLPLLIVIVSLVLRILADTLLLSPTTRLWGAWTSVAGILGYFILLAALSMASVQGKNE